MKRPIGAPCWIDLLTSDEARAREFYTGVFGWTAGEGSSEFGGYFMFLRDGVPVAGGMQKPSTIPPPMTAVVVMNSRRSMSNLPSRSLFIPDVSVLLLMMSVLPTVLQTPFTST